MIRLAVLLLLVLGGGLASAQSLRIRSAVPQALAPEEESNWASAIRYSVLTDYADTVQPRTYTQSIRGTSAYKLSSHWSVSADASIRYETVDGQIEKDSQESYTETLNPSTAFEVDYEHPFMDAHAYTLFMHGEPLWDEPSRREGYQGIVGSGASLAFVFFKKVYTFSQVLDVSELINSYKYGIDNSANPDVFYTYKMVHSFRLMNHLRAGYSWGVKLTRYLDGFTGYSYSDTFSLSSNWGRWTVALAYDNGGFTDNGQLGLWYIDRYRRVGMAMLNYSF